jgi:hypothetical protein
MRERLSLEREVRDLAPAVDDGRERELSGSWTPEKVGAFEVADWSTPDQDEAAQIRVASLRFPGTTNQVALVFAGVHGEEPEGIATAEALVSLLTTAAGQGTKPRFTTIVIKRLVSKARNANARFIKVGGKPIEPNRNFPAPGESYAYARERGTRRSDKAELLDCRGVKADGDKVTHRMLAETRILLQLIEQEQPVRATSIHSHSLPGRRGDGPGTFVDPRGLFNEHTDVAFTADGRDDDKLATDMLDAVRAAVDPLLPLKDNKGKVLSHPLQGNLADASGRIGAKPTPTVHYTSTKHACGTSFGGWAPVDEHSGSRPGITTITIELPRYRKATKALENMVQVHAKVLASIFLGLP